MKRFVFRLDAVRRFREIEQEGAYEVYGGAVRKRHRLEEACQKQSSYLCTVRDQISGLREAVFPAALQPHFFGALQDGEDQLKTLLKQLSRAEIREQECLEEYLEAKSRVDMLVRLREKRYETYMREEARAEEKEIEDLFNARFILRKAS